jgi:hypothetical protein
LVTAHTTLVENDTPASPTSNTLFYEATSWPTNSQNVAAVTPLHFKAIEIRNKSAYPLEGLDLWLEQHNEERLHQGDDVKKT